MTTKTKYFCPMRKVRVYLKKINYPHRVTRNNTQIIFRENTKYYLEGKITCRFYSILAQELLYRGNDHHIWKTERDILPLLLKFAAGLYKNKSKEYISRINFQLIEYLQKRKQEFSLSTPIITGLKNLIYSYTTSVANI